MHRPVGTFVSAPERLPAVTVDADDSPASASVRVLLEETPMVPSDGENPTVEAA